MELDNLAVDPLAALLQHHLAALPRTRLDAPDPQALPAGALDLDTRLAALAAVADQIAQAKPPADATGPARWIHAQAQQYVREARRVLAQFRALDASWAAAVAPSLAQFRAAVHDGHDLWTGYWNASRTWTAVEPLHESVKRPDRTWPYRHACAAAAALAADGWTTRVVQAGIGAAECVNSGLFGNGVGASPVFAVRSSGVDRYLVWVKHPAPS